MMKLAAYGIDEGVSLLRWTEQWLSNRKQRVLCT